MQWLIVTTSWHRWFRISQSFTLTHGSLILDDETPAKEANEKHWLWVARTALFTVFVSVRGGQPLLSTNSSAKRLPERS